VTNPWTKSAMMASTATTQRKDPKMSDAPEDPTLDEPPRSRRTLLSELRAYAESRGSTFLTAAVIIAGQAWLANSLALRPVWLLPAVSAALLIASAAVFRSDREEPSIGMRWLARGVVAVLALTNAICLLLLVQDVFTRSTLDPLGLLLAGVVLWVVNIAVFALAYWEVDGGGPEDRARDAGRLPDLVFPQQQADQEGLAPEGWTPSFSDYLYVSVTAATAFSPTDAMPYSRTAKLLMGTESTLSIAIVAMLVARAVNIAKG
jgi:hypothetical protein